MLITNRWFAQTKTIGFLFVYSSYCLSCAICRLLFIGIEPFSRRVTVSILALHVYGGILCLGSWLDSLLNLMLFVGIDFAISLIDWSAFTAYTLRNACDNGGLYDTLIVVDPSDTVVVCITYVDFDVSQIFIIET